MRRWSSKFTGLRFSTPVVLIYALASFVGALIALNSPDRSIAVPLAVAALVSGVAVLTLLLLRTLIAGDRDVDVIVFILIALGVGTARGVFMMIVGAQWGLITQASGLAQILNSGVSAIVWLLLAGLVFAGRERYQRSYRSLLIQGATNVQAASLIDTDWDHNPVIVEMRTNVSPHITQAQLSPTPAALMRTADAIRTEIEMNLRPLSHRLWFGSFDEYPHVRLPVLVKDSIATFHMPVRVIGAAWLIGGSIGGPMLFGVTRGILSTLVSAAVLVALLLIFATLARRRPNVALGVVYLLVAGTVPLVSADVALRFLGFDSDFTWDNGLVLLLPLALISMMIMGLTISMANADRSVVLLVAKGYAASSADGLVNALEASTYLHNTVQAELTGVAMRLRAAAASDDPQLSRAAVDYAQEVMTRSLTQGFVDQRADPRQHIDRVAKAWQGICDVEISVAPEIADDPRGGVAIQAVEELIANAVRHSEATHITAALTHGPEGIAVTCRINRQWQAGKQAGLGTRWLTTLAPRGIEMTQTDDGTSLRLTIA